MIFLAVAVYWLNLPVDADNIFDCAYVRPRNTPCGMETHENAFREEIGEKRGSGIGYESALRRPAGNK